MRGAMVDVPLLFAKHIGLFAHARINNNVMPLTPLPPCFLRYSDRGFRDAIRRGAVCLFGPALRSPG